VFCFEFGEEIGMIISDKKKLYAILTKKIDEMTKKVELIKKRMSNSWQAKQSFCLTNFIHLKSTIW